MGLFDLPKDIDTETHGIEGVEDYSSDIDKDPMTYHPGDEDANEFYDEEEDF